MAVGHSDRGDPAGGGEDYPVRPRTGSANRSARSGTASDRAILLFVTEVVAIQERLAAQRIPESNDLLHALKRLAQDPAARRMLG